MNFINQYSALLFGLGLLTLVAVLLLRRGLKPARVIVLVLVGLGLLVGWYVLRPQQTPHAQLSELQAPIGAGTPVLLELQSPY